MRQAVEYDDIHRKIKSLRKKRKITIQALSGKTGLTQGYLSKIENNPTPPPIPTLVKIAYGLNVHISYFFEEEEDPSSGPSIIRQHERKELIGDYTNLGYRYEGVIRDKGNGSIKPLIITLPNKTDQEQIPYNYHDGDEMIYILEGQLDFFYGDQAYRVSQGDTVYFDAAIPHKIVSAEKKKAVKVLSVLSL